MFDTDHKQLTSFVCFLVAVFVDGQIVMKYHEKELRWLPKEEKQKLNNIVSGRQIELKAGSGAKITSVCR